MDSSEVDAALVIKRLRRVPQVALEVHGEEELTEVALMPRRERLARISVMRRAWKQTVRAARRAKRRAK